MEIVQRNCRISHHWFKIVVFQAQSSAAARGRSTNTSTNASGNCRYGKGLTKKSIFASLRTLSSLSNDNELFKVHVELVTVTAALLLLLLVVLVLLMLLLVVLTELFMLFY